MKIPIVIEIEIDGECSEQAAYDCFCEYFDPLRKISPAENDDDFQVWVKGWEIGKPNRRQSGKKQTVRDNGMEHPLPAPPSTKIRRKTGTGAGAGEGASN